MYRKSKGAYDENRLYDKVLVDAQCTHDGSVKHVLKVAKGSFECFSEAVCIVSRKGLELKRYRAILQVKSRKTS